MRRIVLVTWLGAATALGGPVAYDSFGGDSTLQAEDNSYAEARFKADTTNWDMRLAKDGTPLAGDNQGHLGNGLSFFEDNEFLFELVYVAAEQSLQWTVTAVSPDAAADSDPVAQQSLDLSVAEIPVFDTLGVVTSGSRGLVQVSNLRFDGLGGSYSDFPNHDVSPDTTRYKDTYLYFDGQNLQSADWSVSGSLRFSGFTKNNPNEGTKLTLQLRNAMVPEPATLLLCALGLAFVGRRDVL